MGPNPPPIKASILEVLTMTNKSIPQQTPAPQESPQGQEAKRHYQSISSTPFVTGLDPAERIAVFTDLVEHGDWSAAGLCLADAIISLPPHKRQSVIDLIIWAILKADTMDWGT